MALDLRVSVDPIFEAFGVAATVTRPAPEDTDIDTTVVWESPLTEAMPGAGEFSRQEWRRVMSLRLDEVPTAPRGTIILAPEVKGGTIERWRVEGPDRIVPDLVRVVVVRDPAVPED